MRRITLRRIAASLILSVVLFAVPIGSFMWGGAGTITAYATDPEPGDPAPTDPAPTDPEPADPLGHEPQPAGQAEDSRHRRGSGRPAAGGAPETVFPERTRCDQGRG